MSHAHVLIRVVFSIRWEKSHFKNASLIIKAIVEGAIQSYYQIMLRTKQLSHKVRKHPKSKVAAILKLMHSPSPLLASLKNQQDLDNFTKITSLVKNNN